MRTNFGRVDTSMICHTARARFAGSGGMCLTLGRASEEFPFTSWQTKSVSDPEYARDIISYLHSRSCARPGQSSPDTSPGLWIADPPRRELLRNPQHRQGQHASAIET